MSAKLIQVIECEEHEGAGVEKNPFRIVVRYYTTEGTLLAERDEWKQKQSSNGAAREYMERFSG